MHCQLVWDQFGRRRGSLVIREFLFLFNDTATTEIYTLSLHDALPICIKSAGAAATRNGQDKKRGAAATRIGQFKSWGAAATKTGQYKKRGAAATRNGQYRKRGRCRSENW